MSVAASSTTATSDPQTWVFPPPGAPTPPIAATSNFGPLYIGDSIVLDWYPPTSVEVLMTCFSSNDSLDVSRDEIASGIKPPFTHTFSSEEINSGTLENYCHMFFNPSVMGNTVVWEVLDESPQNRAVTTFSAPATSTSGSSTSSATSTSSSSSSSSSSASTTSMTPSPSPSPSSPSSSNHGVAIGVGVGVGVGIAAIIAAIGLFLLLRRRRNTAYRPEVPPKSGPAEVEATEPVHELHAGPQYPVSYPVHEMEGSKVP